MGYEVHHAIIVTSWKTELLNEAHNKATDLGMSVTDITKGVANDSRSFLVAPDGSKEGWELSNRGDAQRKDFTDWLNAQRYEDDSTPIDWVEVQFGDDELDTRIVRDSDQTRRERYAAEDRAEIAPTREASMSAPNAHRCHVDIKSHLMNARQELELDGTVSVDELVGSVFVAIDHLIDAVDGLDDRTSNG